MGIAKVKQVSEATVTSVSKGPGTYPYMAPEMFKKSHRGTPVDIFSLGCLFIELFGRRRVWPNLDAPDIMMRVMGSYETPPQMPDTSDIKEPYKEICHKLCQLEAAKRPKSGDVMMMLKSITLDED
jgi:serine/threonine protein kinase